MKVTKRYNQHRRDLWIDVECEACQATETIKSAYDDSNYWVNVVPNKKCKACGNSTNDIGAPVEGVYTRYPEGMDV